MKSLIEMMREMPGIRKCQPGTASEIAEAQKKLNLTFADEYIEYLKEFGSYDADGTEFTGIFYSEYQGKTIFSVVEDTIFERQVAEDCGYEFPADFYLLYNLSGILVCQNAKGEIFEIVMRPPIKIFNSFAEYFAHDYYNNDYYKREMPELKTEE